jgi:leucyl/phenylalanyl-tRNA--protein transferase
MMSGPYWIHPQDDNTPFPQPDGALRDPNGLLAIGANLSTARLLEAYREGIFPWYNDDQPILWWSPDPRSVLFPEKLSISRSLRKSIRNRNYRITFDQAFEQVIRACSEPRSYDKGTWINRDMIDAYCRLHDQGYAHSVECWHEGCLVGGLYGVSLGRLYFGESMFSTMTDASKVAFVVLVRHLQLWQFPIIDCQVHSRHLASLGAETIPRAQFLELVHEYRDQPSTASWRLQLGLGDCL